MEGHDRVEIEIEKYRLKAKFLEDLLEEIRSGNGFASYAEVMNWIEMQGYTSKFSLEDFRELERVIQETFPAIESTKAIVGCISCLLYTSPSPRD